MRAEFEQCDEHPEGVDEMLKRSEKYFIEAIRKRLYRGRHKNAKAAIESLDRDRLRSAVLIYARPRVEKAIEQSFPN